MRRLIVAAVSFALLALPAGASADDGFASECAALGAAITLGAVQCQRIESAALGATTAFSYYVPESCAGRSCPVMYLLHGTGGSYRSMLGQVGAPTPPWVAALTSGPGVDYASAAPWTFRDHAMWPAAPVIDMVLVAPHNAVVPGGYGPAAGTDGFWSDWNPKYANGSAYAGQPPRFDTHVMLEVIPWVEEHLPVGRTREYRAINGHSQGGLGALLLGLQHPDAFATITATAGASIPLGYVPAAATMRSVLPRIGAPVDAPYAPLPAVVTTVYPKENPPADPTGTNWIINGLRAPFLGYGDPVADEPYWRGNTTQDLAMNARAWSGATQSLPIDLFNNDAIDYGGFEGAPVAWLEVFANYIQAVQMIAFDSEQVAYHYERGKGTHGGNYTKPYFRYWLERIYSRVRHADGSGSPALLPDRFDFRTIRTDFSVWGWTFHVARDPVEFLTIRDASCSSITLQGSGVATVTVPASCGTGLGGSSTFTVHLGPSYSTDEHAMASYTGAYNAATTVALGAI